MISLPPSSLAMSPVVFAATLAAARAAMGVTDPSAAFSPVMTAPSLAAARTALELTTNSPLNKFAVDMAAGTATGIRATGDSTVYGYLLGGSQANPTVPAKTQEILRAYYNNTAATVTNRGISGWGTTDWLAIWDAELLNAEPVFTFNCCINDYQGATSPAISGVTYANNLRTIARKAKLAGKVLVFITPNPVLPMGGLGTVAKAEGVKQFAQIMREVAAETGTPLIDIYALVSLHISNGASNVFTLINDGIHPAQSLYTLIGVWVASAFIFPDALKFSAPEQFYPAAFPGIRRYTASNIIASIPASRLGVNVTAGKIVFPIWVSAPGLDIVWGSAVWGGGSVCDVKINGVVSHSVNVKDANLPASSVTDPFGCDYDLPILENAKPGFYYVEIASQTATAGNEASLYYVAARKSRVSYSDSGFVTPGTVDGVAEVSTLRIPHLRFSSSEAGDHVYLTDNYVSNVLRPVVVEFDATLQKGTGLILFGKKLASGGCPMGGLLIGADITTGFLTMSQGGGPNAWTATTALGAVDLSAGGQVPFRVEIPVNGLCSVYINSTLIGTYQITRPMGGGFIGVLLQGIKSARFINLTVF